MKPTGNPQALDGIGSAYRAAAEQLETLIVDTDTSAHQLLDAGWSGTASLGFLLEWGTHRTRLREAADGVRGIGDATGRLANGLDDAQRRYRAAQSMVAAAGGVMDNNGSIVFPRGDDTNSSDTAFLAQQMAQEAEAEAALAKARAAAEFESLRWTAQLASLASQGLDMVDSGGGNLALQVANATERLKAAEAGLAAATLKADELSADASELGRLMTKGSPEERSLAAGLIKHASKDARAAWEAAADSAQTARAAQGAVDALKDPGWARALKAVSPELKLARGVPVLGLVANGIGFFGDLAEDNPWQEAALRTGASWAAGALVVGLLVGSMATGVGEVIVVAALAGLAAYVADRGVQYCYEHWDAISRVPGQVGQFAQHAISQAGSWLKHEGGNALGGLAHLFGH